MMLDFLQGKINHGFLIFFAFLYRFSQQFSTNIL